MPAWTTSLLRALMPDPKLPPASAMTTSCPARVSSRATASPMTPAPTTSASSRSASTSLPASGIFRGLLRQLDDEAAALRSAIHHAHRSSVRLHGLLHDDEPEAEPAAVAARLDERLEELRGDPLGEAAAGVEDFEQGAI